jgi:hypothetical protein
MKDVYNLTSGIMDKSIKLRVSDRTYNKRLYNLEQQVDRSTNILRSIITNELKRL